MAVVRGLIRRLRMLVLGDVYRRLEELEYNSFNRRFYAIEQAAEYLVGAQVPGDYLEFGVYQGRTFSHACKLMGPLFEEMRFVAFDSFDGLPTPRGIDAQDGYTSRFHRGEFRCSKTEFFTHLKSRRVDVSRVTAIEGWFDQSLTEATRTAEGLKHAACVWIDCDLYESTVPVLQFITPMLSAGAVLLFDDWHCFRNHPDFGQQRATREWLTAHPTMKLAELFSFGSHGVAFTVVQC